MTTTKTLSHIGVYVNGSGVFGDKARPKDKGCEERTCEGRRNSRDLVLQSIPSRQESRVRLMAHLGNTRLTFILSRSPSPAATQMFFC